MNFKDFFKQYKKRPLNENLFYLPFSKKVYSGSKQKIANYRKDGVGGGSLILRQPMDEEIRRSFVNKSLSVAPGNYTSARNLIYTYVLTMFGIMESAVRSSRQTTQKSNATEIKKLKNVFSQLFWRENKNAPASTFFSRCDSDLNTINDTTRKFQLDCLDGTEVTINITSLFKRNDGSYIRAWKEITGNALTTGIYKQLEQQLPTVLHKDKQKAIAELSPQIISMIQSAMDQVNSEKSENRENNKNNQITPKDVIYALSRYERNSRISSFVTVMNDKKDIMYQFQPKPKSCGGNGEVFNGTVGEYEAEIMKYLDSLVTDGTVEVAADIIDKNSQKGLESIVQYMNMDSKKYPGGLDNVQNFIKYLKNFKLNDTEKIEYNKRRDAFYDTYEELSQLNPKDLDNPTYNALEKLKIEFDEFPEAPSTPIYFLSSLGIKSSDLDSIKSYEELNNLIYAGDNCFKLIYMAGYNPKKKRKSTIFDGDKYEKNKIGKKLLNNLKAAIANNDEKTKVNILKKLDKLGETSPKWRQIVADMREEEFNKFINRDDSYIIGNKNYDDGDVERECLVYTITPKGRMNITDDKFKTAIANLGTNLYNTLSSFEEGKYIDVYSYQPRGNDDGEYLLQFNVVIEYPSDLNIAENMKEKDTDISKKIDSCINSADKNLNIEISENNRLGSRIVGVEAREILDDFSPEALSGEDNYIEYGPDTPDDVDTSDDEQYYHHYKTKEEIESDRRSEGARRFHRNQGHTMRSEGETKTVKRSKLVIPSRQDALNIGGATVKPETPADAPKPRRLTLNMRKFNNQTEPDTDSQPNTETSADAPKPRRLTLNMRRNR